MKARRIVEIARSTTPRRGDTVRNKHRNSSLERRSIERSPPAALDEARGAGPCDRGARASAQRSSPLCAAGGCGRAGVHRHRDDEPHALARRAGGGRHMHSRADHVAGAAHRGGPQRLPGEWSGRRARSRAAAGRLPHHGRGVRCQVSAGPPLRSRALRLLARSGPGLSRPHLCVFGRRHLQPSGLFAARVGDRFHRPGLAPPRVHQRSPLQLEFANQRRRAHHARPPHLRASAPVAPADAVVRDVPLPGGLRGQRAVLARRSPVGRRRR